MPIFLRSIVVAMAIVGAGCGSSPTAPRTSPGPAGPAGPETPASAASVTSIRIGATPVLRAPGETGQMTVEAFFSNGTSVDRTAEALWTSHDTSVATVAPGGLVTAVGFGATHIDAVFEGKRSTADVLITPPGTFAALGVVREPGSGPLAGVVVQEMDSNRSTTTDQNGEFHFAALQRARFRVASEGFEVVERDASGPFSNRLSYSSIPRLSVDIPLQRIVRLDAGASRSQLTIAPDDVSYPGYCYPCKLVRVATGRTGTLRVTVSPQGANTRFFVWIDGKRFSFSGPTISAQAAIVAPGDALVYVGWSLSYDEDFEPGPVSFGITTSIDDQ
jgi:hypothetical protein